MTTIFLHGFVLALGLILPLGVQNLFVFQQGINQQSFYRVLPAIITAAVCDTVLIALSVAGMSALIMRFAILRVIMTIGGIIFLVYMGYKTWNDKSGRITGDKSSTGLSVREQVVFAMSVSFLNPYAFLDIMGVIGTSSIGYQGIEKLWFSISCISVSWLWFTLLGFSGHCVGMSNAFENLLKRLNRFSALFIWSTAVYMITLLRP